MSPPKGTNLNEIQFLFYRRKGDFLGLYRY